MQPLLVLALALAAADAAAPLILPAGADITFKGYSPAERDLYLQHLRRVPGIGLVGLERSEAAVPVTKFARPSAYRLAEGERFSPVRYVNLRSQYQLQHPVEEDLEEKYLVSEPAYKQYTKLRGLYSDAEALPLRMPLENKFEKFSVVPVARDVFDKYEKFSAVPVARNVFDKYEKIALPVVRDSVDEYEKFSIVPVARNVFDKYEKFSAVPVARDVFDKYEKISLPVAKNVFDKYEKFAVPVEKDIFDKYEKFSAVPVARDAFDKYEQYSLPVVRDSADKFILSRDVLPTLVEKESAKYFPY